MARQVRHGRAWLGWDGQGGARRGGAGVARLGLGGRGVARSGVAGRGRPYSEKGVLQWQPPRFA